MLRRVSWSGPPQVPWLEPDVGAQLAALHDQGAGAVVIVPIGFVADHFEVVWDLDVEALGAAARLGLPAARAATPGVHPAFVTMVADLVAERLDPTRPVASLGRLPPRPASCADGCCPAPARPH